MDLKFEIDDVDMAFTYVNGVKEFCLKYNINDVIGFNGSSILKIIVKKNHRGES